MKTVEQRSPQAALSEPNCVKNVDYLLLPAEQVLHASVFVFVEFVFKCKNDH